MVRHNREIWRELFEQTAVEQDPERLAILTSETEFAIVQRFRDLYGESELSDEMQKLRRAAMALLEIRIKKLGWPDPFKVCSESGSDTNSLTGTFAPRISQPSDGPWSRDV